MESPDHPDLAHPRRSRASRHVLPRARHHARRVWLPVLAGALLIGGAGVGAYAYVAAYLPDLHNLKSANLAQVTKIYDRRGPQGGTLLQEVYTQRRIVVRLNQIAPVLRDATVAVEDRNFYSHHGVNPLRILSAAYYDVVHGQPAEGASTIDEQVIKLAFRDSDRSLATKLREALLSLDLERIYSKDEILEYYLNTIYYGNQAYGAEAAAQTYFGVSAASLDLAQASLLAGLPQRPATFDPLSPDGYPLARARQGEVLAAMVSAGRITQQQADSALAEDLQPALQAAGHRALQQRHSVAPHFVDYVQRWLEDRYGVDALDQGGLVVTTSLDLGVQREAVAAVTQDVASLKHGVNNGAMLAMDPRDGEIRAMVGSANYYSDAITGQINMTLAPRQPGSSFKPYVYGAALEEGPWTPSSTLLDAGGYIGGIQYHDWDGGQLGAISLSSSLALSRNISSVHLFQSLGYDPAFDFARRVGITTPLKRELGTVLGSSEVRMLDHLTAYSAFANGGFRVDAMPVLEVRDAQGDVLERFDTAASTRRVIPAMVAYQITSILKTAVNSYWSMGMPVAGKSGTTNDFVDSWYVGYTTDLAWSVWVGHTEPGKWLVPMDGVYGETGAGIVWRDFGKAYYQSRTKPADWSRPRASQRVDVCPDGRRAARDIPGLTHVEWVDPSLPAGPPCQGSAGPSPGPGVPGGPPSPLPSPSPIPVSSPSIEIEESPSPTPQSFPTLPVP